MRVVGLAVVGLFVGDFVVGVAVVGVTDGVAVVGISVGALDGVAVGT